jgi:uncharacterized membrane protein YjgN (DUF898 family)
LFIVFISLIIFTFTHLVPKLNTSFQFEGADVSESDISAFSSILFLTFIAMLGFISFVAVFMQRSYSFIINHLAFGSSRFTSRLKVTSFIGVFFRSFLVTLIIVVIIFVLGLILFIDIFDSFTFESLYNKQFVYRALGLLIFTLALSYIFLSFVLPAYFRSQVINYIWSNTFLENHCFKSDQTFLGVLNIAFTNTLFMFLTLGLYWPWAKVNLVRYRIKCTALLAAGSLDDFAGRVGPKKGAIGEEVADIFDFDIGI